ncbi:LysM peptidoglycan-binding domain-containing protein [Buchnera aphidicola (Acyrthosiphon lactucae)]|uniref:LysM peptidoglycan-binding domain-containing protein n=1 Tax=Buchnera aphidicola (Acyrthosiphon lactucae) TaxID=1241832 RepID=A0A4D6XZ51_9GAMM|nr:peptidoglycan DD-metalloendopeptidase family protein [Buchnera aphidicola]QCI17805.1 LysM peptidoglycan-binding domain-containing protein [Buchnera aphidicola (Acyrthosiphon lactucae)]
MQLKNFLFKLFFLLFLLISLDNFAFGLSKNYYNFHFNKKYIKDFLFLKKNECFTFLKSQKIFFFKKEKVFIGNNNFIGFFQENRFKIFYIVKSKDTLYSIAKNSGYNYNELSNFNAIKKPYKIIVGQKIWMGDFFINKNKNNCSIVNLKNDTIKKYGSCEFIFKTPLNIKNFLKNNIKSNKICFFCNEKLKKNNIFPHLKSFYFSNNWYWPVKNTNIQYFYNKKLDNKKIEISGFKGQPVFSAATGEVVCVTNLFKKYGQLIIIRHNKNYLSIYAFNDSVLVKEKDKVYAKQQIATMGLSSDTNLPQLYFEIRYLGESINPLNVLPKIHANI